MRSSTCHQRLAGLDAMAPKKKPEVVDEEEGARDDAGPTSSPRAKEGTPLGAAAVETPPRESGSKSPVQERIQYIEKIVYVGPDGNPVDPRAPSPETYQYGYPNVPKGGFYPWYGYGKGRTSPQWIQDGKRGWIMSSAGPVTRETHGKGFGIGIEEGHSEPPFAVARSSELLEGKGASYLVDHGNTDGNSGNTPPHGSTCWYN